MRPLPLFREPLPRPSISPVPAAEPAQGRFFRLHDGGAHTAVNAPVLEPFARRSPLRLARDRDAYAVLEGGEHLVTATPFAWPRWYGRKTSDGTPMSMVVSARCDTSLYTAIYQGAATTGKGTGSASSVR